MLVPTLIFGAVVGTAWVKAKPKRQAAPDPMVAHVFRQALDAHMAPDKYRKLAAFMEKYGYLEEARVLNARASYGELPQATRDLHTQMITKALTATDPILVRKIADNLYRQGAIANGTRLRRHAAALDAAAKVAPVAVAPPTPPPPPAPPPPAAPPVADPTTGAGPSQESDTQQAAE